MKLYTEEQVDKMLSRARMHKQDDTEMFTNEYLLSQETPIELPSDEEIDDKSALLFPYAKYNQLSIESYNIKSFQQGAKWIKEQILNKNK